jgi:DNA polymerase-3 subunit epsilon
MMLRRRLRRMKDHWQLRRANSPWVNLFQRYQGVEMVSLDIETTSLDVAQAQILSIGAVIIRGSRVLTSGKLALTIVPPEDLPYESVKVHKLRRMDLDQGLPLAEALDQFLAFVGNRPIVGYNIGYDLAVLDRFLRPAFGFGLPNACVDIMQLFRRRAFMSGAAEHQINLTFEAIAECMDVPILGRHTALGDATTTAILYVRLKSNSAAAK